MTDRLVAQIQALAKNGSGFGFSGLSDYGNGRQRLYVTSTRALIAFKTVRAAESNGRYTPPPNERSDIVSIQCGDSDLGEIFECSRVRVTTLDKRLIKPLSYSATPNAYHNALGARWTVREVFASYSARELRDGFTVDYASFDGTEWSFPVSREDADSQLLLRLEDVPASPALELYGKFQLGTPIQTGGLEIPTPVGSSVSQAPNNSKAILEFKASEPEVHDFYLAAMPKYKWVAEKEPGCWSQLDRYFSRFLLCVTPTGTTINLTGREANSAMREELQEERKPEEFGKFVLGPPAKIRGMAIPTPNGSVVDVKVGPPDLISLSITATNEDLREFYGKALPRYSWQAQSSGQCWARSHPISSKSQVLCIDFSLPNTAILRITESQ